MGKKLVVFHRFYGCDTGCCGHAIALYEEGEAVDTDGDHYDKEVNGSFSFDHPWDGKEEYREFAKEMIISEFGEDHVKDLDWENCVITDEC